MQRARTWGGPPAGRRPPRLLLALLLPLPWSCERQQPGALSAAEAAAGGSVERVQRALPRFEAERGKSWPPSAERVVRAREALRTATADDALKGPFHMLRRELEENPENDEAALFLGVIQQRRANFGAARPYFERVLERGPSFASSEEVFFWYGLCLRRLGDPVGARESLTTHQRLAPAHGKTRYYLGQLALEDGDLERAAAHFEQALEAFFAEQGSRPDEDIAEVYASLGDLYMHRGELEQAEEALQTCVRLWPAGYDNYYKLARVLTLRGDAQGAERAMTAFQRRETPPVR